MSKTILSVLFLSMIMACNAQNTSFKQIGLDQYKKMANEKNTLVIDVRTPEEVAQGYIVGTDAFINFYDAAFDEKIAALDKKKTYIVYCRSGNRSSKALNKMAAAGFTKLYEVKGGVMAVTDPALMKK